MCKGLNIGTNLVNNLPPHLRLFLTCPASSALAPVGRLTRPSGSCCPRSRPPQSQPSPQLPTEQPSIILCEIYLMFFK